MIFWQIKELLRVLFLVVWKSCSFFQKMSLTTVIITLFFPTIRPVADKERILRGSKSHLLFLIYYLFLFWYLLYGTFSLPKLLCDWPDEIERKGEKGHPHAGDTQKPSFPLSFSAEDSISQINGLDLCVHHHIGINLCRYNALMTKDFADRIQLRTCSNGESSSRVPGAVITKMLFINARLLLDATNVLCENVMTLGDVENIVILLVSSLLWQ